MPEQTKQNTVFVSRAEAWRMLLDADDVLLLTHRLPDGDAVGSLFALLGVLRGLGKRATYLIDEIPADLRLAADLPPAEFTPKTVITVDVADKKLLSDAFAAEYRDRVLLSIDHHASNVPFAAYTLVDPAAAAAAEVLFDLFTENGVELDPDTARRLYVGVSTDTGCFRYGNTTAKTLRTAAALLEAGADAGAINERIFETRSRKQAAFEAAVVSRLRYSHDGRIALSVITQSMFKEAGVGETNTKNINALPRQIEGVLCGITMKEKPEGGWRVSVRTKGDVNAAAICGAFGGGGHRQASGCDLTGTEEEAAERILAAAAAALPNG